MRRRGSEFNCLIWMAAYLALSTGAYASEGKFDRTLPVAGPVELNVQTGAGSVSVTAGGPASVEIHATIRAWPGLFSGAEAQKKIRYLEAHPPINQHGNTITLGTFSDLQLQHNISISYELIVPAETRLKCRTGSGDQRIAGLAGPLELSAASGTVEASRIGGSIEAFTGSGRIELDAVEGGVRAGSGSGTIRAWGVGGGFRAETGSGDITLEQTSAADARVSSASGSILLKNARGLVHAKSASGSISAEGGGQEPWHLETISGNVMVRVPPGLGFDLHAHTVSGNIATTRPLTLQGNGQGGEICGKAGNGGFLLDVSTVSGDVQVDWVAAFHPPSVH